MKLFGAFIMITASLLFEGCSKDIMTEKEGNNSFSTANPLVLQKPVQGFLDTAEDIDLYSFSVDNLSTLDIRLSGIKGVNNAFSVWKGGDQPVLMKLVDDNRKSSPERMANFCAEPGMYYISVQHGDRDRKRGATDSSYTLTVDYRDSLSEEIEPNDNRMQATPLTMNSEITGYFSPAYNRLNEQGNPPFREEDWYSIQVELDGEKPLLLDVVLSEVPGVNSIISFFGENTEPIAVTDYNATGMAEEIKGMGITVSGTYYIMITSRGYQVQDEKPYYLNVSSREYDSTHELEPNNSRENANTIGNNSIYARFNTPDDRDFFRYEGSAVAGVYRIEVQPDETSDVVLAIYTQKGKRLIEINNAPAGGKEIYPNLSIRNEFYCEVYSKSPVPTASNEYTLLVEPLENIRNMENEPNDSKESATLIIDDSLRGYISRKDDRDYLLVQYDSRRRVEFEIRGVKDGVIKVSVTDPLGYILKSVKVVGDSVQTLTEMIDRKGYLIIEPEQANYENPYEINLRGHK
ncbi:MAG: hypothetical protein CVV44_04425 [Spirochaetae bacterium HGW-Spirochaetae-1]|jgi:hypothetical protein|nr:MAG: hypothetical protein CVV44_04425 [Spirochaetae bacterium HGW-Spirochaetae-1]